MSTPFVKKLTFSILVEQHDKVFYVAHCLETGLVAAAADESDVVAKMSKLLDRQVRFALEHNRLEGIYHLAPSEVITKFQKMERLVSQSQRPIKCDARHGFTINETAYAAAC
jgi:hypothetical protein